MNVEKNMEDFRLDFQMGLFAMPLRAERKNLTPLQKEFIDTRDERLKMTSQISHVEGMLNPIKCPKTFVEQ